MKSQAYRANPQHQGRVSATPFPPPRANDPIALNSLGSSAQRKARRFIDTGELAFATVAGRTYCTRGDLADWEVIDFGCSVSVSGEFAG